MGHSGNQPTLLVWTFYLQARFLPEFTLSAFVISVARFRSMRLSDDETQGTSILARLRQIVRLFLPLLVSSSLVSSLLLVGLSCLERYW